MPPKISGTRNFCGKNQCVSFLMKYDSLLENIKKSENKPANLLKKDLKAN